MKTVKTQLKDLNATNLAKTTNGGDDKIAAYFNGITFVAADGKEYHIKGSASVFGGKEGRCPIMDRLVKLAKEGGLPEGKYLTFKVANVSPANMGNQVSEEEVKSISLF